MLKTARGCAVFCWVGALFRDNRFGVIILHASKRPEWELIVIYAAEAMTVTKDNRIFLKKGIDKNTY